MVRSRGQDVDAPPRGTTKKTETHAEDVGSEQAETNPRRRDGASTSAQDADASTTLAAADEDAPLLSDDESPARGIDASQETKGLWYMMMLTISIAGLQLSWSVELSNGSPYLLSLGLSKSLMALVWIAGPLTGTLVVPYVGVLSDNCGSRWGKRRPFLVGGTAATVASLMFLAWTREIVGGILAVFGADAESRGVRVVIIAAAVAGIYVLDIAINTVQAAIRALMVDCAPAHQQEEANAMASRVIGIGNILGYVAGYVNLPAYLWFLGDSQFKILCALASIGLAATVALSTAFVHERSPQLEGPSAAARKTPDIFSFFFNILRSIRRLPPQTMRVCQVQFFAWVGFFPLLFYTSSYVGEIYAQPFLDKNPDMTPEELDALYEQATRIGTFALLVNAIVSVLTNVLLPFFITPTSDNHRLPPVPSAESQPSPPKPSPLHVLRIPGLTLRRAWLGSLVLCAASMFCTVLVRSVSAATALVGLTGVTWAMTLWAPWAIISAEISHRDVVARARKLQDMPPPSSPTPNNDAHVFPSSSSSSSSSSSRGTSQDVVDLERSHDDDTDQAGVILGIHNMAIAVPQMVATLGSSLVFKIVQKPRGTPGDHSFAIVMALGGIFILVSCFFAFGMKDDIAVAKGVGAGGAEDGEQRQALLSGSD